MVNIDHTFVEQTTEQTHTGDTTYTDISGASIASGNFIAGNKYLIITNAQVGGSSTGEAFGLQTLHGSTVFAESEYVFEPTQTASDEYMKSYTWFTVWTAVASEGVKLQFKTFGSGETVKADQITMTAIELTELTENTDWLFDFNTTDTALTTSFSSSNNASVTFTPSVASDWLVLAYDTIEPGNTNQYDSRIEATGGLSLTEPTTSVEGETDSGSGEIDKFNDFCTRAYSLTAVSHTFTQQARNQDGSSGDRTNSAIFAINLNSFKNHSFAYTEGEVAGTAGTSEIQSTTITPDNTKEHWMGSFFTFNPDSASSQTGARMQVDNVDQPPTQTSDDYFAIGVWDNMDLAPFFIQSVDSLDDSAHDVDLDVFNTDTGQAYGNRLAFAVQLQTPSTDKTFTVNAILQATFDETFTVDARLKATFDDTFTVDAILQATFTFDFTVDALPQATQTKTFTVDAFIQALNQEETFTTDAILKATFTETFLVDAFVKALNTNFNFLIDGFIQAENQKMFLVNGLAQATFDEDFTVDAIVVNRNTETFDVDSILIVRKTTTFTVDGLPQEQNIDKTFLVDGFPQATFTETFLVDGFPQATFTFDFLVDGFPQATINKDFTVDGLPQEQNIDKTFLVDGFPQATFTTTFTVDAIIVGTKFPFTVDAFPQATFDEDFLVDAFVQQLNINKDFTVDSVLVDQFTESFIVDSLLEKEKIDTFTLDSLLQGQNQKMFLVDGELSGAVNENFIVDGLLEVVNTETFDVDSILKATQTETSLVDSILVDRNDGTFDIDGLVKAKINKDFTVDSRLFQLTDETFLIDAELIAQNTETYDVDVLLAGVVDEDFVVDGITFVVNTEAFLVDAELVDRNTETFEVDAKLVRDVKTDVDAILKLIGSETPLVDAILQDGNQEFFLIDGLLVVVNDTTFTVDAVLAETKTKDYTVDALLMAETMDKTFTLDAGLAEIKTFDFTVDARLAGVGLTNVFITDAVLKAVRSCDLFFTEPPNSGGWTLVGNGIAVIGSLISGWGTLSIVRDFFRAVPTLPDNDWTTEYAWKYTIPFTISPAHFPFSLANGTSAGAPISNKRVDMIVSRHGGFGIDVGATIRISDGTTATSSSIVSGLAGIIDLDPFFSALGPSPTNIFYTRLEKAGTTYTLSLFKDEARTIHYAGSPISLVSGLSVTGLKWLHTGGFGGGNSGRALDGDLFDIKIIGGKLALPSNSSPFGCYDVDALLQGVDIDKEFTVDAVLKEINTEKTFLVDGNVELPANVESFTVDAQLANLAQQKNFIVDTFIQQLSDTETFTVDAILINVVPSTFTKNFTINALLKAFNQEEAFLIRAITFKVPSNVIDVDAMLQATLTETPDVDAILVSVETETFELDAFLVPIAINVKGSLVDALLQAQNTNFNFLVDGNTELISTVTATVDALLKGVVDQLATVDSILTKATGKTFLVDAILLGVSGINKPFTINALLQATFNKDFQVDTFSQAVNTEDFLVDGLLTDGSQKFFLINAILILLNEEEIFTVNANLRIITQLTPLVDAVLKAIIDEEFLINALLEATQTEEFTVDAKISTPVKFTVDAFLAGESIDVPFFVDAMLSKGFQKLFIVDAKLVFAKDFTVSAFIKALGDVRCQPSYLELLFSDDLTDTSNWSAEINNTGVDGWGAQRIFIDGESVSSDGIIRATMRPGGFSPFQESIFKTKYRRKAIASEGGIGVIANGSKVRLEFEYKHLQGSRGTPIGLNKSGAHPQNDPNTPSFHIREQNIASNIALILDDGTTAVQTPTILTNVGVNRFIVAESIGNTVTLSVYSDPEHTSHVAGSPAVVDSSTVNKNGLNFSWLFVGANSKLSGPNNPSTRVEMDEIKIYASPCPVIEVDAFLKEFFGVDFTVDAVLKRQIQVDVDAVLRGRKDFTVDSILIIATKTQVDAVLSPKGRLVDFTINALLKKQDEVTADIDALLQALDQEYTFTIDSNLVVKSLETFFIDAQLIQNTVTVLPFVDALLKILDVEGQTFVNSILVVKNVEETLVNSILKKFNVEEEFIVDGNVKAIGLEKDFIVDILISTPVQITTFVDAVLKLSGENGFCNFYPDTVTIGTGLEQFVGPITPEHESNVDLLIGQEFTLNNQQVKRARILLHSTGGITVPSVISGKIWRNVVKGNVAGEVVQLTSINTIDADVSSGDLPTGVWTEVVFDFGATAPFLTGNFLIGIQHTVGSGINDPTGVGVAQPVISGGNVIAGEALFRREDNSGFPTPDTWKVLISDAIDMVVDLEIVNGDDIVLGKGNQCPRVDSIVVDRFTEDSLVDAILVNRNIDTFTINAVLQTTDLEEIFTINSILSPLKEFTIDAQLVVIIISNDETFIVDARLQFVNQPEPFLVDSLLIDGFQKPFIVDALFKKQFNPPTFVDAQIQALDQEEDFIINATLFQIVQPEVIVDGFLVLKDEEETFTITGALAVTQPPVEFTIDAQINDEKERFRIDAQVVQRTDETFIVSAWLAETVEKEYFVDSIVKLFNIDEEFLVDTLLLATQTETFTVDAELLLQPQFVFTVDAILPKDGLIFEFTVGSIIVRIAPLTINALVQALGDNGNNEGENPFVDNDDGGGFFDLPLGTLVGQRLRLPSAPVRITDYTFTLRRSNISGTPAGTLTGKIYKQSIGGNPILVGDLIDTSDNIINIADLTTSASGELITFTYSNPQEISEDDNAFVGFDISGANENVGIEVEPTGLVIDGGDLNVEFVAGTWGADLGVDTKVTINIDVIARQRGSALIDAIVGERRHEFIVDAQLLSLSTDKTFTIDAKVAFVKDADFTVGARLIGSVDLLIGAFVGEVQETVLDVESVIRDTTGDSGIESTIGGQT